MREEDEKAGDTAVVENEGGPETKQAIKQGAPIVSGVQLLQDGQGNLRAIAVAVNPSGPPPRLVYRWFRDGTEIKTEERESDSVSDP